MNINASTKTRKMVRIRCRNNGTIALRNATKPLTRAIYLSGWIYCGGEEASTF
jgi:hypothetical protein